MVTKDRWFLQPGVYGESERATFRPSMRPATYLEQRRLSQQPEFVYFLPFLPLAICPDLPDVLGEYCQACEKSIQFVHWRLDQQLIPSLWKREIDTANIFGIEREVGLEVLNFARGVILQDEKTKSVFRLLVQSVNIIEPGVSAARPAEKILADRLTLYSFCVQSGDAMWRLQLAKPPTHCLVVKDVKGGDPALWSVMRRFWTRGVSTKILD